MTSTGATSATKSWTNNIAPLSTDTVSPTQTTTYTATCTGPGGSKDAPPVIITVTQPVPPTPTITVDVEPKTFTCNVGGQANVGATVKGTADQRVNWSISDLSIVSQKTITEGTIVLSCMRAGAVVVTATALADARASDHSNGLVTAGTATCTWTPSTGLQPDGTVQVTKGTSIGASGNCNGNVLPDWYSSDPFRVGVKGDSQTTVNGKVFETGNNATITAVFTGQASVCMQAALDQTSPAFCRTVVVK